MPQSGIVGPYRVVAPIAGRVHRAEHHRIGRAVALKRLGDPRTAGRDLAREGRLINTMSHENVVLVTDMVQDADGELFMVMELLPGTDLERLLRRQGPPPLHRAVPIALQICQGLEAVHRAGVVHGNIRPEHVCIWHDRVKLVGFGAAAPVGGGLAQGADVLALGQLLEALFVSRQGMPAALDQLVRGCLAPEPARRPSVAALVEQLEEARRATAAARAEMEPRASADRPTRPGRRIWLVLALLATLVAAGLVRISGSPGAMGAAVVNRPPAAGGSQTVRPRLARVVLRSEPAGATVFRRGDLAVSLGRTPLELWLPNPGDVVEFVFHRDGYTNASAAVVVRDETHVGIEMEPEHADR